VTITEFLLARIAEDEAAAQAAAEHQTSVSSEGRGTLLRAGQRAGRSWTRRYDTVNARREDGGRSGAIAYVGNFGMDLVAHISRHDPARVLAECEAKRRIVDEVRELNAEPNPPQALILADYILQAIAGVYADHPDFREEWRA
jgi:hypothetical protein